jgi:hypothetical protein
MQSWSYWSLVVWQQSFKVFIFLAYGPHVAVYSISHVMVCAYADLYHHAHAQAVSENDNRINVYRQSIAYYWHEWIYAVTHFNGKSEWMLSVFLFLFLLFELITTSWFILDSMKIETNDKKYGIVVVVRWILRKTNESSRSCFESTNKSVNQYSIRVCTTHRR